MATHDPRRPDTAAPQRGLVCWALSSRTQVGQWHSGLCKPVLRHVVATVPPSRLLEATARSARGACTPYNGRDPENVAPSGTDRRPSKKWWHSRAQADSPPRQIKADGTALVRESGRVRDDSHALASALDGRVPGPLDSDDRPAPPVLEGC